MVQKINTDRIKSSLVATAGLLIGARKGPDELFGDLFRDVQERRVYTDGKTFVDLVPKARIRLIQEEYRHLKDDPNFDLSEFVHLHFYDLSTTVHKKEPFQPHVHDSIDTHIRRLWHYLEYRNRLDRGSLMALPYPYIVPGGRFSEQFYWDSYFIMLGLAADNEWAAVEHMVKNCAFMLRKYGHIPSANRTYFLSRSQPPVFCLMVRLLAEHKGKRVLREYLPYLQIEYRFWMRGRSRLAAQPHHAFYRLVQMKDGAFLNRYYDSRPTPRPESLREDTDTALNSKDRVSSRVFLHLRAAAESGWDFSSRWCTKPLDFRTIHTADIIPVDLNSLLYLLEETIADAYNTFLHPIFTRRYRQRAAARKQAVNHHLWSQPHQFYLDYNFHAKKRTTVESLAGVFPLFAGIASEEQAEAVAHRLKKDFLKPGGLVTTLLNTGQQWDSPNGWAPLQWVAIKGLERYGYHELAADITKRWLTLNEQVFKETHILVEKYDVVHCRIGGGGEYTVQNGFGWTNGVYRALKKD